MAADAPKPPPSPAAVYAHLYPSLVVDARELGYALALHGSMARDLDLVAIPWTDDAASARAQPADLR